MAPILAATDFSEVAENAVHYACQLALGLKAPLTLLHAFVVPLTFNDTPMPVMPVDEGRSIAEERMEGFVRELRAAYPELSIQERIAYGDVVDVIQECIEEQQPALVVLGNSGAGDSDLWLGSNVVSALKQLPLPVVAVPPGVTYSHPRNLCLALDLKGATEGLPAGRIQWLVKQLGAQLHILHIDTRNREATVSEHAERMALEQALAPLELQYHELAHEDVDEGIRQFLETHSMDWLMLMPKKYSFLEGLFHKSHTKAMVRMSRIPLVALHHD